MNRKKALSLVYFICLFLIFIVPRFYNLEKRIPFDWDQEKIAYEVKNIAVNHKPTLLGPRANNDRGFFLGPQLTYVLIPFFMATKMHPQALFYFVIFYDILFFLSAYFILKSIFGTPKTAVFLVFWSLNPMLIENDVAPFWPIFIPLGVLLVWHLLFLVFKKNMPYLWLFLGLVFGFFFNMHFQFIFVFIFICAFLFISRQKIHLTLNNIVLLLAGIGIMFLPLILFDIRHHFFNASLFFRFFTEKDSNVGHWLFAWIPVFSNIANPFLLLKGDFFPAAFLYGLLLIVIILQMLKSKGYVRYFYVSSLILWVSYPFFFSAYGKRPSEYYFDFIYPFMIISLSDFFVSRKLNITLIGILILFFCGNMQRINTIMNVFGVSLYEKNRAVRRIARVLDGKKCDIAFNAPRSREVGYKFLFEYYGIKTIGDWKSCVININIPPRKGDELFGSLGITFPKDIRSYE